MVRAKGKWKLDCIIARECHEKKALMTSGPSHQKSESEREAFFASAMWVRADSKTPVIPAKAGIQFVLSSPQGCKQSGTMCRKVHSWIPAFAGMTEFRRRGNTSDTPLSLKTTFDAMALSMTWREKRSRRDRIDFVKNRQAVKNHQLAQIYTLTMLVIAFLKNQWLCASSAIQKEHLISLERKRCG